MTAEEVTTHLNSRQIDAQVAQQVMGIKLDWYHEFNREILNQPGNKAANNGRGICMACPGCRLAGFGNEVDWEQRCPMPACKPYSTDIAAAWEVFTYIMENKPYSKRRIFFNELQAYASRGMPHDFVAWPDVLGLLYKDMPLAICMAALRAVGGE